MERKGNAGKKVFAVLFVLFLIISIYIGTLHKWSDKLDTRVICQNVFCPGTKTSARVIVLNHEKLSPVKDAELSISLKTKEKEYPLFSGKTDDAGSLNTLFDIPADVKEGPGELLVKVKTDIGKDEISEKIRIARSYKIYLTTDKPIYQPGQTIHIRALAMETENTLPSSEMPVTIEVEDAKGNKIFKTNDKKTSKYGIVFSDFILAREAMSGDYKIRGMVEGNQTEITVQVKPYVLPKFKVSLETDKRFYRPGELLKGELKADYFFGKPVLGGDVKISLATFDVQFKDFAEIAGKTDKYGNFTFRAPLETYFSGQPLEQGKALLRITAEVTDKAQHKEIFQETLFISNNTIDITLVPEGGEIVPGVENIVYVVTSYPDGSPAKANVNIGINNKEMEVNTDQTGLGEFKVSDNCYSSMTLVAKDGLGNSGTLSNYYCQTNRLYGSPLLRSDKAVYKDGDVAKLEILSSSPGTIFLDVVKNRQTRLTKTVTIDKNKAELELPLTHDLVGTIQFHAYRLLPQGNIVRDTLTVYVEEKKDLSIKISSDKNTYRPGETGKIEFQVKDKNNNPLMAALGISVVDESVFALAEKEPGLEKIYFTLEEELMKPKYEICSHYIGQFYSDLLRKEEDKKLQKNAKVALASLPEEPYGIEVNTYIEKFNKIKAIQERYFNNVASFGIMGIAFIIILSPLVLLSITFYNERLKGKDENRYLVVNNENVKAIIIYVAGFFLIVFSPFLFMFALEILRNVYYIHNQGLVLFPLVCSILGAIFYIIFLGKMENSETIKAINTLRYSFIIARLYMIGLLSLITLLLFALMFHIRIYNIFSSMEIIFMFCLMAFFAMPGVVIANGISHMVKPKKLTPRQKIINFFIEAIIVIIIILCLIGCLIPCFLKARATGNPPVFQTTDVMEDRKLSGGKEELAKNNGEGVQDIPAYLRQYFPETMYFNPELITDEKGKAEIDLKMADSITTWRMSVSGSSLKGEIGGTDFPIKVFQDFFIDLDLPLNLTEGDEVSLPVAVYNYLPEKQNILLRAEKSDWFDFLGNAEQTVTLGANDVGVVYYPIKVKDIGKKAFTVYASTSRMNDAIKKEVSVIPNGKEFKFAESGWLKGAVTHEIKIPPQAIVKANDMWIKIYPGLLSQLIEGLDSMLHMPYG